MSGGASPVGSLHDECGLLQVVGLVGGDGKHTGLMGALQCKLPPSKDAKKFKVGTGFTNHQRKNPPSVAATFCVSVSAAGAGVASLVASVVVTVVVTPDAWALVTVVVVVGCEMGGAVNYVECKRKKVLFNG